MFKHILIPTDGSKQSEAAAKEGIRFARETGARVTCFHAIPRFHTSDVMMGLLHASRGDYEKAAMDYATGYTRFVSRAAHAAGVECDVEYATTDDPAAAIVEAARKHKCDLILMASHGRRGMEGLLLGSETQKVLTHSRIPVLVYR
jgi:nucleotide-binding universal stress UspA family protein